MTVTLLFMPISGTPTRCGLRASLTQRLMSPFRQRSHHSEKCGCWPFRAFPHRSLESASITVVPSSWATAVVRRDTQIFPLPVGCKNFVSVFFGGGVGITSKQEPQGWIGQRRDLDNSSSSFYRIPRLLTIVVSLKANCSADRPVVLLPSFVKLRGGTRKIGSKATRFDDRDLDAERSNL